MRIVTALIALLMSAFAPYLYGQTTSAFSGLGVGITAGRSIGVHSIDLEVAGQSAALAADRLNGAALGMLIERPFMLGDWRIGPQLVLQKSHFQADGLVHNESAHLKTQITIYEMHALRLMAGRVWHGRYFPYLFVGIGVADTALSGEVRAVESVAFGVTRGYVAGPQFGLGIRYAVGDTWEWGLEFAETRFNRRFERCEVQLATCVALPLRIEPKSVSFVLVRRF